MGDSVDLPGEDDRIPSAVKVFTGIFFLNLTCGAFLTTAAAFFGDDDERREAAYVIFGLHLFFSVLLAMCLLPCILSKGWREDSLAILHIWTFTLTLISLIIAGGVIAAEFFLVTNKSEAVNWIMLVALITVVLNCIVFCCCCCFPNCSEMLNTQRLSCPEELTNQEENLTGKWTKPNPPKNLKCHIS